MRALQRAWLRERNRLLASAAFQRWMQRIPFARPIANRRARRLFDLCAGFVYSQTLFACVQSGVFERLRHGPATEADLRAHADLPPDSFTRLIGAACSLELLERTVDGAVALGVHGAALLGNPGVLAMIEHHALFYADLRDPLKLLRERSAPTELSRFWAYAAEEDAATLASERVADYSRLMTASHSLVCDAILDAYPLEGVRVLLDVGGGEGAFAIAATARRPALHAIAFDLPVVAQRAKARVAAAGASARIEAIGGDFRTDPLPRGADLVTFVRVLHDHDDAVVARVLRAAYSALPPGGAVLIAEPMSDERRADPVTDAYFSLYLLAMRSGRPRSVQRLSALLREAGFTETRERPSRAPLQVRLLEGRRR